MELRRRVLLVILMMVAAPAVASAYVVKKTSKGAPVHWLPGDVTLTLALTPGPPGVDLAASTADVDASLATWQAALDGTGVTLVEQTGDAAVTNPADGINNVRWAQAWNDSDIEVGVLALTFVSYQTSDGAIRDADIVLNAADFAWTATADCRHQYDLEGAMTHEVGHFLGLAHSADPDATMFATGGPCQTGKRDLAADDTDGLDSLYRVEVDTPPPVVSCAAAGSSSGTVVLVVLACALALGRRRRAGVVTMGLMMLGLAAPARAAQLRRVDLAELGRGADLVVRGRVIASAPASDGQLATDSVIAVDECVAGGCPATVSVRRRGGERDGVGLWVDGEAELAPGAEVVVYLRVDPRGHYRVRGGVQGVLQVVEIAGTAYAVRDLRGQHVLVDGTWQPGEIEVVDLGAVRRSVAR